MKARKTLRTTISNVASTKKSDTMQMAIGDGGPAAGATLLNENQYFFIWSPSYLERNTRVETEHTRNAKEIFFRGVQERWFVRTEEVPWTHRRVVFYSTAIIPGAAPYIGDSPATDGPPPRYRPLGGRSRLTFTDSTTQLSAFFQGTINIDWIPAMAWDAKFDTKRFRVLSDSRKIFNPSNDTGKMGVYKTWVEINTPYTYVDNEWGSDTVAFDNESGQPDNFLGWTQYSAKSPGQLYFLDIFSRGPNEVGSGSLLLQNQATVYWHEK